MNCDKINDYSVENSEIFLVIIMITADFDYHDNSHTMLIIVN